MLEKRFHLIARLALLFTFLVILAGSVVRTTGSGMGCPDWPKCFGYYIPPTSAETITWAPQRTYLKGQMILHDESLWKATKDFTSGDSIAISHWERYVIHDYTLFNPAHTWTEYVNRLVGALAGIPILLLVLASFLIGIKTRQWRKFLLSFLTMILFGFEAWLGKVVVEGNLIPHHITLHMLGAVVIVLLLVYLIYTSGDQSKTTVPIRLKRLMQLSLGLIIIQVVLGSQVRQQVDVIAHASELNRQSWIDALPLIFKIHRSYTILVLMVSIGIFYMSKELKEKIRGMNFFIALMLVIIVTGVALTYAGMPQFAQPTHLILGTAIIGLHVFMNLQIRTSN